MMVGMTADDFRRLALSLPDAVEGSHHGNPDFRVDGKVFATLAYEKQGFGVVLVGPEEQRALITAAPWVFLPVVGEWGRKGATRVRLADAPEATVEDALRTAWRKRRAVKRLPT
jgi:hypothetical protein